jgi:hypothetical protein
MLYNPKRILLAGAVLLNTFTNAIGDCDNGPWNLANVLAVGGQKGNQWCSSKQSQGIIINGVEVYYDKNGVNSLQWYYTDDSKGDVIGHAKGDHQKLTWDPSAGEMITSFKCWGNGKGEWLGKVSIQAGKDKALEVGKNVGNQDTFDQKTESGILVGAFGNADKDRVISLGLLFLKSKIDKMSVQDIVYVRLTRSYRTDSFTDLHFTGREARRPQQEEEGFEPSPHRRARLQERHTDKLNLHVPNAGQARHFQDSLGDPDAHPWYIGSVGSFGRTFGHGCQRDDDTELRIHQRAH